MLRFFRQIRKTLMEQNKIRTYLLYAVGEILLVMIGILLALQVNNWNEERKLVQEEQYLVQELKEEFTKNLALVQRDYRGNRMILDATKDLMDMFHIDHSEVDVNRLDSLLIEIFMSTSFDPSTGVVEEIISTGRLSVLRDDSLRYLISQWPSILLDQKEDIDIRGDHFFNILLPEIMKTTPFKNGNRYFNFDFWDEDYERVDLSRSVFPFNAADFFTLEMESYLYTHSLNQDFILLNDLITEDYIEQILRRLEEIEG